MFNQLYKIILFKRYLSNYVYTKFCSLQFSSFGKKSRIGCYSTFEGLNRISIGQHSRIGRYAVITAWENFNKENYTPRIVIGNNCSIGEYVHITAIKSIIVGNNVLIGRRVTISDNSHGVNESFAELQTPPNQRKLYSKGEVVIEDNVWIGDKATILAGVRIGFGSIIGANAVVTKDIPAFSIVGGVPARILRKIKE